MNSIIQKIKFGFKLRAVDNPESSGQPEVNAGSFPSPSGPPVVQVRRGHLAGGSAWAPCGGCWGGAVTRRHKRDPCRRRGRRTSCASMVSRCAPRVQVRTIAQRQLPVDLQRRCWSAAPTHPATRRAPAPRAPRAHPYPGAGRGPMPRRPNTGIAPWAPHLARRCGKPRALQKSAGAKKARTRSPRKR
jgi:hypothetical protein